MTTPEPQTLTRKDLFIHLYEKAFPHVATFVRKRGGSLDDARDIFQDSLVIYYEKCLNKPEPVIDEAAYLSGIAKHLWYKKFKEQQHYTDAEDYHFDLMEEENEPKVSPTLLAYLEISGKKCLELLKSFYYDHLNMKEVAQKFGFSGERSATAQKFKCLEKVREAVKKQSLKKSDFYE